jgi:hypothetical protein
MNVNTPAPIAALPREERSGSMAEKAKLAVIAFEEVQVARPNQHIRIGLRWRLSGNQASMNVDCLFVFVIERQAPQKLDVFRGNLYVRYIL